MKTAGLQHAGRWTEAGGILAAAGRAVERAGADFPVLCTNTMHKVASQIEEAVGVPLLHIADATASRVKAAGLGLTPLAVAAPAVRGGPPSRRPRGPARA